MLEEDLQNEMFQMNLLVHVVTYLHTTPLFEKMAEYMNSSMHEM